MNISQKINDTAVSFAAAFLAVIPTPPTSNTAMDWLKTDNLSVPLGVGLVVVYALTKYLQPQSLVHPLLMGRQSDVGRVRMPGESAVYRNYATGIMGRLPERPKPEIKLLGDLIQDANSARRKLWSTTITNAELKARVEALGNGLTQVTGLTPRQSTALLLLDDSLEFLITDLALASQSIVSFTLASFSLLTAALVRHAPTAIIVPEQFLEQILEHLKDLRQSAHHFIIVLGDEKGKCDLYSQQSGIRILRWEDIEAKGGTVPKADLAPPPEPSDVFSVSFFADIDGELRGAQLTHANVTAGVTASRLLFPLTEPISPSDTLLSVFSITSAFGRSLAYTALHDGANFISLPALLQLDNVSKTSPSSQLLAACEASAASPTILMLTPNHLKPLTSSILKAASSNLLFSLAWRHKLHGLNQGFITRLSFWDNLIFDGARTKTLGKLEASLRGIIVSEGQPEDV
ncbi:hypothetical protein JB92DRAFT_2961403 [Gautieria morchelliformis]|nr:hypothetical protein JB92DRAFT_2961403 [Gautieria morchelliformis]